MGKLAQKIVIKPIITEASIEALQLRKYTFAVAKDANKVEIAKAIEELFDVKVEKVNTMNCLGKNKRMGRYEGKTPDWKKAIVTLKEGEKTIEFFDNLI